MNNTITIAIDGHSSTGKSTLAKQLAQKLGYVYVDTGAMYRCVTLFAMRNNLVNGAVKKEELIRQLDELEISFSFNEQNKKNAALLNGEEVETDIRTMAVNERVSRIAAIPEVRARLVSLQQQMGRNKGVVMDGRDIGTVVFPNAELKVFMTARPEVRAQRRFEELLQKGEQVSFEEVLDNLNQRDDEDSNRKDSPLMRAEDALLLDNSDIDREEQFSKVLDWAKEAIQKGT